MRSRALGNPQAEQHVGRRIRYLPTRPPKPAPDLAHHRESRSGPRLLLHRHARDLRPRRRRPADLATPLRAGDVHGGGRSRTPRPAPFGTACRTPGGHPVPPHSADPAVHTRGPLLRHGVRPGHLGDLHTPRLRRAPHMVAMDDLRLHNPPRLPAPRVRRPRPDRTRSHLARLRRSTRDTEGVERDRRVCRDRAAAARHPQFGTVRPGFLDRLARSGAVSGALGDGDRGREVCPIPYEHRKADLATGPRPADPCTPRPPAAPHLTGQAPFRRPICSLRHYRLRIAARRRNRSSLQAAFAPSEFMGRGPCRTDRSPPFHPLSADAPKPARRCDRHRQRRTARRSSR